MNWKQLASMWCGIGLVFCVAIVTVLDSYDPDYVLFVSWAFLVILVTVGLIITFRTKNAKRDGSREMNLRKGFKRLVFILSLIPALIGIAVFVTGLVDEDEELLIGGLLTALIGFVAIWAVYGVVLYIVKGFNANYCANCEREIGKLEEQLKFKEYMVCTKCHKKLSENQKAKTS